MVVAPHSVEVAIQTVDRKIAAEQAPVDAEGVDQAADKRSDRVSCPVMIDHREAADLGKDVAAGCKLSQALPPAFDRGSPTINRHAGIAEQDGRVREFASEFGGIRKLRIKGLQLKR